MNATTERSSTADREIASTRVFDAPRDLVFEAWTSPEHVAQWWGPNGVTTTTQRAGVRVGRGWVFGMDVADGAAHKNDIGDREGAGPERPVSRHRGHPRVHATLPFAA